MTEIQLSRRALLGGIAAASVASSALAAARAPASRWSEAGLDAFRARAKALGVRALVVISDGRTLVSDGDVAQPFRIASCRKSFLSTLYGLARSGGKVDLDATLEKLGVDDYQPLTPVERSATLRQLLQARSGIYIPSAAETPAMKAARPARGSHAPGTFWYYNNWDFNALGEIYQRVTGRNVFTAFEHELARPLGFQDFDPMRDARWDYDPAYPRFPAYDLWLSARDMAKLGQLFLQQGQWNGAAFLSPDWIRESTTAWSKTDHSGLMGGYGYLWWIGEEKEGPLADSFTAAGNGGRYITVLPRMNSVVAVQPFEEKGQPQALVYTRPGAYQGLVEMLASAYRPL